MTERRSRVRYDEDTPPDPVHEERAYSRWHRRDRDWTEGRDRRDGREARSWRSAPHERQDSWRRRREQSPIRSHDARPRQSKQPLSPVQHDTPSIQDADADQMAAIMGFGNFGSSKVRGHTPLLPAGKTRGEQFGGLRTHSKRAQLAAIHESVCILIIHM